MVSSHISVSHISSLWWPHKGRVSNLITNGTKTLWVSHVCALFSHTTMSWDGDGLYRMTVPIIHQTQQTLSETMLTDAHDCLFLTNNLISLMLNPFSTHIKSSLTTRCSLRTALLQPLPNQHYTYDGHLP